MVARNWGVWLLAKLLVGLGQGFTSSTMICYLSEIAPAQIRGTLTSSYGLGYAMGQLFYSISLQIVNVVSRHPADLTANPRPNHKPTSKGSTASGSLSASGSASCPGSRNPPGSMLGVIDLSRPRRCSRDSTAMLRVMMRIASTLLLSWRSKRRRSCLATTRTRLMSICSERRTW